MADGPVGVYGLRRARDVMDAQDAGTVCHGRDADALRGGIARGGVCHAGDRANEALAADGREHGVTHGDHGARSTLDDHVLVGELIKARAGVDADAVMGDAGAHERASLVT